MSRRNLKVLTVLVMPIASAAVMVALSASFPAHNRLVRSSPADGATLDEPPSRIVLWFAEAPLLGFSVVTVSGPEGAVKVTKATVGDDRSLVATMAQPLPPGTYTVSWRTAGDDGHAVRGTLAFVIRPRPSAVRP